MVEIKQRAIRYQIQRRIGIASAVAIALIALFNLIVGLSVRRMSLGELVSHPSILVLFALSAVAAVTALRDWVAFRIVHVVFFLGYPLVMILVLEESPYDMSFLAWSIYGIILCIQYRLLHKRLPYVIGAYILTFFLLKLYQSARNPDFTFNAAMGVAVLLSLFVYLFWVVFAEEIREYMRTNDALQAERNANLIFVKFGKNIAGVIHNMKSAMMSFTGYSELLDSDDPETVRQIIGLQQKASEHMLEMINNFMTAVRSYQRTETSIVELNRLVRSSIEVFKGNQDLRKRVKIHEQLDKPDTISGKPMEIMQLIDNLVKNAAESMLANDSYELWVKTFPHDGSVLLQVEDQGEGIPFCASCVERDCTNCIEFAIGRTTKEEGTGIGVVYVQQIVREMGAKLKIESKVDLGTTVSVYFRKAVPSENA
jgi:signal transduction histidine kinase